MCSFVLGIRMASLLTDSHHALILHFTALTVHIVHSEGVENSARVFRLHITISAL